MWMFFQTVPCKLCVIKLYTAVHQELLLMPTDINSDALVIVSGHRYDGGNCVVHVNNTEEHICTNGFDECCKIYRAYKFYCDCSEFEIEGTHHSVGHALQNLLCYKRECLHFGKCLDYFGVEELVYVGFH